MRCGRNAPRSWCETCSRIRLAGSVMSISTPALETTRMPRSSRRRCPRSRSTLHQETWRPTTTSPRPWLPGWSRQSPAKCFETVLRDRLLVPLGLEHTFLFPSEIANRRHAIGHVTKDGRTVPVPEWPLSRCETAEGGVASSVTDQMRYARFHLTGVAAPGPAPIGDDTRRSMWRPRSTMNSGPQVGINWLLRSEMGDFLGDYEAGDSRFEVRREGSRLQTSCGTPSIPISSRPRRRCTSRPPTPS